MVNNNSVGTVLAGLIGFLLGGLVADAVESATRVLLSAGTLGGFLGAAMAALRDRDIPRWSAIGGGAGVGIGAAILLADAIVGV